MKGVNKLVGKVLINLLCQAAKSAVYVISIIINHLLLLTL